MEDGMGKYYRRIDFDSNHEDGFSESVQFVGVYVLNWHKRPAQPEVAFVEANEADAPELLRQVEELREALRPFAEVAQVFRERDYADYIRTAKYTSDVGIHELKAGDWYRAKQALANIDDTDNV